LIRYDAKGYSRFDFTISHFSRFGCIWRTEGIYHYFILILRWVAADYVVVATELPGSVPGSINLISYEHIVRVELIGRKGRKAA
jgi:hypothetical protein